MHNLLLSERQLCQAPRNRNQESNVKVIFMKQQYCDFVSEKCGFNLTHSNNFNINTSPPPRVSDSNTDA